MNKISIITEDGFSITTLVLTPTSKKPKAVIQFHSGTVTKKEFYLKLAKYLVKQNYIVVLFDYRGVGESKPKSLKGFDMTIADWGQYDAPAITSWIKNNYPSLKIFLVAHSMGGQIYGMMKNWEDFDRVLFLTTSSGNFNKFSPKSYQWKIKWPSILLFPILYRIYGYIPGKFGVGEDWPMGVAIDWSNNSKTNGLMPEYLHQKAGLSFYKKINKEIRAWYFPDDKMSTPDTINELALSYPNADLTISTIYPVEVNLPYIGHFGLFKSTAEEQLWPRLIYEIEQ